MKLSKLAEKFHQSHELDGSTDYTTARAWLIGQGINPNHKNDKGKNLVTLIVHYYENNKDQLSNEVDFDS